MLVALSEQMEVVHKTCFVDTHSSTQHWSGIPGPHADREVKERQVDALQRCAMRHSHRVVTDGTDPSVAETVLICFAETHLRRAEETRSLRVDQTVASEIVDYIDFGLAKFVVHKESELKKRIRTRLQRSR